MLYVGVSGAMTKLSPDLVGKGAIASRRNFTPE